MKKGVSLVTVLLFMMVATIAATATYKLIGSVGGASAARLKLSEAREAAQMGINATRSWMTFKGNDVGALVRQYFEGKKKPILLNSVLPRLSNEKMKDSVWLVGADIDGSNYRLKILSVGTLADNTSYHEVAVLNVNGLYQVQIPTNVRSVPYNDAFHGSMTTADVINVDAAVIKRSPNVSNAGGQALNSITSSKYLVLDGNFYVNDAANVRDLYVSGDLSFGNSLNVSGNLYVGGMVYATMSTNPLDVRGTAYLNGGMNLNEKASYIASSVQGFQGALGGRYTFHSNVTCNGDIEHFAHDYGSFVLMERNLVMNGKIKYHGTTTSANDNIRVLHNAFVNGTVAVNGAVNTSKYARKTMFGTGPDDKLLITGMSMYSDDGALCRDSVFHCATKGDDENLVVAFNGTYTQAIEDHELASWGADPLTKYGALISEKQTGACNLAKGPLMVNSSVASLDIVHKSDRTLGCSDDIWKNTEDAVSLLNECYTKASARGELYNKSWLIVEFPGAPLWTSSPGRLQGNFVFIINGNTISQEWVIPQTGADSYVMLYLPNGWPNTEAGNSLRTADDASDNIYNYFIYSKGNIGRFNSRVDDPLRGSIYMDGCASLNTLNSNDTLSVQFNENLVNELVRANLICENNGTGSCSNFAGVSTLYAVSGFDEPKDPFHIATSPQLTVAVESQYRNNEPSPAVGDFDLIQKTAVVLPRIIYLTRDAVGTLSDYYNVVALNGSRQHREINKMTCPSQIHTAAKLSSDTDLIDEGVYLCSYSETETNDVIPVFVVVHGLQNAQPDIKFDQPDKAIAAGSTVKVYLRATDESDRVKILISAPIAKPFGWDYTPNERLQYEGESDGRVLYSLETSTTLGSDIEVFTVSTEEHAALSDITFQLESPCTNCNIGQPDVSRIYISNRVYVERTDFGSSLCSQGGNAYKFMQAYGVACNEVVTWPSCEVFLDNDDVWVTADGLGCSTEEPNHLWRCATGGNTVRLREAASIDNKCKAFIPDSQLVLSSANREYKLPAVVKRKPVMLNVRFHGDSRETGVNIEVKRPNWTSSADTVCYEDCDYRLFAGDTVFLLRTLAGYGKFSYWACKGEDCPYKDKPIINSDTLKMTLSGLSDDTVAIHFNEKDRHCFYADFTETEIWCNSANKDDCIDKCKSGTHCSIGGGNYKNADWLMVYSNDGNSFVKPALSNGYISPPDGFGYFKTLIFGIEFQKGEPTLVLNTALAGYNGKYTSMIKIPSNLSSSLDSWRGRPSDDGLVFRSNASGTEYFLLSIITHSAFGYAKLCYVTGRDSDNKRCQESVFQRGIFDNEPAVLYRSALFGDAPVYASINLDIEGSDVVAFLSYNTGGADWGSAVAKFDLTEKFSDVIHADEAHQYVGFKLGVPHILTSFELYDIGWTSTTGDYADSCWASPAVTCSFRANYEGGMVPKDSMVTPWVALSSWFKGKNCNISYFYNGCDLRDDRFVNGWNFLGFSLAYGDNDMACGVTGGKGFYRYSAKKLDLYKRGKLKDNRYNFEKDGYHGYAYTGANGRSGVINDASILVYCTGDGANGHTYEASCGDFIVGEFEHCTESYMELLDDPASCFYKDSCFVPLDIDSTINVRESEMHFTIDLRGGSVQAYVMDVDGFLSKVGAVAHASGDYTLKMDQISDEGGFNPQHITGLVFKTSDQANFNITHVDSYCKYAFGVRSCRVEPYNVNTRQWKVTATVIHPEKAAKCKVIGHDAASGIVEELPCATDFIDEITQDNIYGNDVEKSYSFSVIAYDENGYEMDSCMTESKVIPAMNLTCAVSQDKIEQTYGIPSFRFNIDGCPVDGCPYEITYPDNSKSGLLTGETGAGLCPGNGCNNYNTYEEKYDEGRTYQYMIKAYDQTCVAGFKVLPEPPAMKCEASYDGEKFIADVSYISESGTPTSWTGTLDLSVSGTAALTDQLGNIVFSEKMRGDNAHFEYTFPENLKACPAGECNYYAWLVLPGHNDQPCHASWTARAALTDAKCPEIDVASWDPQSPVVIQPNVDGCEDSTCAVTVKKGSRDLITPITDYDGKTDIIFLDEDAAGTRTYTFELKNPNNETTSCQFTVTYNNDKLNTTCSFGSRGLSWGQTAPLTIQSNCEGCEYKVYYPSGKEVPESQGVIPGDNSSKSVDVKLLENGKYKISVNSVDTECEELTLPTLEINPNPNGAGACKVNPNNLTASENATFTATIDACLSTDGCEWDYVLKKDGSNHKTGKTGKSVSIPVTGYGKYELFLNNQSAAVCDATASKKNECYIKNKKDSYKYGETFTFVVKNYSVNKGRHYVKDPSGESVGSWKCDRNSGCSGEQLEIANVKTTSSGIYTFPDKVDCSDNIVVQSTSITCTKKKSRMVGSDWNLFDGTTYYEYWSYYLSLQASGCDNGCTYVLRDGSYTSSEQSIKNDAVKITSFGYSISEYTSYSVSLNGGSAVSCTDDFSEPPRSITSCTKNRTWHKSWGGYYTYSLSVRTTGCENGCLAYYKTGNNGAFTIQNNSAEISLDDNGSYKVHFSGGSSVSCTQSW
ncbi:hypothetical protein [uncultured Fibrobacter sp.]|uniref:hypothetical protein n=1 Tax=uncultured Fibrobacter sp. TaxID=261512 RepID=UPI0025D99D10|nr:hypothetical protein [uncultured Fibrobacter sp.]